MKALLQKFFDYLRYQTKDFMRKTVLSFAMLSLSSLFFCSSVPSGLNPIAQEALLHHAAKNNDVVAIKKLLAQKVNIDALRLIYSSLWTPLHTAAYYGSAEAVQCLIEAGANINAYDSDTYNKKSPLDLAIEVLARGHVSANAVNAVQYLINAGAKINDPDLEIYVFAMCNDVAGIKKIVAQGVDINRWTYFSSLYDSPLTIAARLGNIQAVHALFDAGAYGSKLHIFALCNDVESMKVSLDNGADINFNHYHSKRFPNIKTPLGVAVAAGSAEAVQFLLDNGADLYKDDENLLFIASCFKHKSVVRLLIKKGLTYKDESLIHTFARCNDVESIEKLIKSGANVNTFDKNGNTPLHLAAENCNIPIMRALLSAGADVNARNEYGYTPLFKSSRSISAMKFLLDNGANINARTKDGYSVLYIGEDIATTHFLIDAGIKFEISKDHDELMRSVANNDVKTIKELIKLGANLEAFNNYSDHACFRRTALYEAVKYGCIDALRFLKEAGANINIQDRDGNTPLHSLVNCDCNKRVPEVETLKALIELGADLEVKNQKGETPLHQAAYNFRNESIINVIHLIKAGANKYAKNKNGKTPMDIMWEHCPAQAVLMSLAEPGDLDMYN